LSGRHRRKKKNKSLAWHDDFGILLSTKHSNAGDEVPDVGHDSGPQTMPVSPCNNTKVQVLI